jgi:hypothetical protein
VVTDVGRATPPYIALMSLLREPTRQQVNAVMVAGIA